MGTRRRMVLSFKIRNFRSFADEASFSCLANSSVGEFPDHASPIPDSGEKVLKTSVVYGANGAGKSNLCRALNFLLRMAVANPVRENRLVRVRMYIALGRKGRG